MLAPAEMGRVGVVVSSLPRVGWPLARQRSILEQCFTALRGEGVFLEFSYGPLSPVPLRLVRELGLVPRPVQRVWGNFPPATIWEYRRARTEPSRACVAEASYRSNYPRIGPANRQAHPGTMSSTIVQ